jgi:ABC-type Zn uptake system ZnuABC Zn-binding protein ZnuA
MSREPLKLWDVILKMDFSFIKNAITPRGLYRAAIILMLGIVALPGLFACSQPAPDGGKTLQPGDGKLRVLATTTIVGDVVRNVGGDAIQLDVLVPPGVDEHSFQSTPEDVTKVAQADVIFLNGAGLETFLEPLLRNAGKDVRQVSVSEGIQLLQSSAVDLHDQKGESNSSGDPHVWLDPNNVLIWVENIERALTELAPEYAADTKANAEGYRQALIDLDQWTKDQVSQLPFANRKLVSDHHIFTYFASRYNFQQAGAVIPSYSTLAEPTAKELAALEDAIRQSGVRAIFVGNTSNPALAERVAQDTGVKVVPIYTGSLSKAGGPAENYMDYFRYNVNAIVNALKQ